MDIDMDKALNYIGYKHQFQENDVLILKSVDELTKVNKTLLNYVDDSNAYDNVSWYLSKEKIELLSAKNLKVLRCIQWYMGIPYYSLIMDEVLISYVFFVGEFYLKKELE